MDDDQDFTSDGEELTPAEDAEIRAYLKTQVQRQELELIQSRWVQKQADEGKKIRVLTYKVDFGTESMKVQYGLN